MGDATLRRADRVGDPADSVPDLRLCAQDRDVCGCRSFCCRCSWRRSVSRWSRSVITVYVRDFQQIVPMVIQIGLFATPVAYPLDQLIHNHTLQLVYSAINPLAPVLESLRRTVLLGPGAGLAGVGPRRGISVPDDDGGLHGLQTAGDRHCRRCLRGPSRPPRSGSGSEPTTGRPTCRTRSRRVKDRVTRGSQRELALGALRRELPGRARAVLGAGRRQRRRQVDAAEDAHARDVPDRRQRQRSTAASAR